MADKINTLNNRKKTNNRKKANKKRTNKFVVVTLYGLLLLLMVFLSTKIRPQIMSAEAEQEEQTEPTECWAGVSYSDMDILLRGELTLPVTTHDGSYQLRPTATGVLTHDTSANETILLSDLLVELGLANDENALEAANQVTDITGSDQHFTITKLSDGDWKIFTKRSFDTLEQITITKNGEDFTVIFKDSLYTRNLNELCTKVELNINGRTYNADNVWGEQTVYVSPKKLYALELSFTERPDKQFSNYEELEYTLPQGFILPEYFNEMGYSLSISMDMGGISVATFTLNLSGNLDLENGRFIFDTDKELKLRQENLHNAIVHKSVTYVPYTMMYEIRVVSDGTTENLLLTDEMGVALKTPENVTIFYAENRHVGNNEYKPVLHPLEEGRMVISIPKMDDEDELIIQYSSEVDINKIQVSGKATLCRTE